MRVNITSIPIVMGIPRKDLRETRQASEDSRDELMTAIALAVIASMDNLRKVAINAKESCVEFNVFLTPVEK